MVQLLLSSIKISHFRTHKLSVIKPSNKPIVIFGLNGAGKTNILEAISMLAPGRGFRHAKFSELSRQPDLLGWQVSAELKILGSTYEVCTFWDERSNRKVTIDGKPVTQSTLGRLIRILWITPQMDRIWLDGSSERRRFLDRIVSTLVPNHTENSIQYQKALKQRNKLIKDRVSDSNWYDALERQMALSGSAIDLSRYDVISQIMAMQKKSISSFPMADLSVIGTTYKSAQEFQDALANSRKADLYAGRTLKGPHLSDLAAIYSSKGMDAKNCSTGEQKALLISLIIATAKIQVEIFNTPPILLFDEVSAHLDSNRRSVLYQELCSLGLQAFLTGTDINTFEELRTQAEYFRVKIDSNRTICSKVDDNYF